MLEGTQRRRQREREEQAGQITGLIWGFRHRQPNLRRLYRILTGQKTSSVDREEFKEMIAESEARVKKEKELAHAHTG